MYPNTELKKNKRLYETTLKIIKQMDTENQLDPFKFKFFLSW